MLLGGTVSPTVNIVDYVTISITGNAIDFGDLTTEIFGLKDVQVKLEEYGLVGILQQNNVIDFCTIATTGRFSRFW